MLQGVQAKIMVFVGALVILLLCIFISVIHFTLVKHFNKDQLTGQFHFVLS